MRLIDKDMPDTVSEAFRRQAMARLRRRVEQDGETVDSILQIRDRYYRNKLLEGRIEMSYTIYDRIMQCSQEDTSD